MFSFVSGLGMVVIEECILVEDDVFWVDLIFIVIFGFIREYVM